VPVTTPRVDALSWRKRLARWMADERQENAAGK
jgi:hypothetical protein